MTPRAPTPAAVAVLAALSASLALPAAARAQPAAPAADSAARAAAPSIARARAAAGDTTRDRPRAVDIGPGYATRLRVHRWGSIAMVPLFATQYVLGSRLLDQREDALAGRRVGVDGGLRDRHRYTAYGVGAVFAVNTVTGAWNLWESRGVAEGRTLRTIHAVSMLAADVGFVATGIAGGRAVERNVDDARRHRTIALTSVGISAASALMMAVLNRE